MGLVPAVPRVSRPPVLGLVALCGREGGGGGGEGTSLSVTPWSQHSHDAAGTTNSTVRLAVLGTFALTGARRACSRYLDFALPSARRWVS